MYMVIILAFLAFVTRVHATLAPTFAPTVFFQQQLIPNMTASYGTTVSMSNNSQFFVIGDEANVGFVLFTRAANTWGRTGFYPFIGTSSISTASAGDSITISRDSSTIAAGVWGDDTNVGATFVFTYNGSSWVQQGSKLVGTGAAGPSFQSQQGTCVALSSNGNTLAVGGAADNSSVGAVWIFVRSGGIWAQQGSKLVGSNAIPSGGFDQPSIGAMGSVALSDDGNTLAMGGKGDASGTGALWIFTRSGSTWTQQGPKIVLVGAGASFFGSSVAISSDGNTVAVGAPNQNSQYGALYVYTRSGSTWTQQASILPIGAVNSPRIGEAVALTVDGNTLLAGGIFDAGNTGAIWTFKRIATSWSQSGGKIVGTGSTAQYQGGSVSVSGNGDAIVWRANYQGIERAVWVGMYSQFTQSPTPPTTFGPSFSPSTSIPTRSPSRTPSIAPTSPTLPFDEQTITQPTSAPGFAHSVSLSGNSQTLVAGYPDNMKFYVYMRSGSTYFLQGAYNATDMDVSAFPRSFGFATAISRDGTTIAVGAWSDQNDQGGAWIFVINGTSWTQQTTKLIGPNIINPGIQGTSVALSGDGNVLAVGAQQYAVGSGSGSGPGGVYMYARNGTQWSANLPVLTGTSIFMNQNRRMGAFGTIALNDNGTILVAGAPGDNSEFGALFVFILVDGTWTQLGGIEAKILPIGAIGSSHFGTSVAISNEGNTVSVGAPADDGGIGATYVLVWNGTTYAQQAKLIGTGHLGNSNMGTNIALSADGNTLIVGGPTDNTNAGAVWLFKRAGSTWSQFQTKIVGSDGLSDSQQGVSTALSSDGMALAWGGPGGSSGAVFTRTFISFSLSPTTAAPVPTFAPIPTAFPSFSPSLTPTRLPSNSPSLPTSSPTAVVTIPVTTFPTRRPTLIPTTIPTTGVPSSAVSLSASFLFVFSFLFL